MDARGLVAYEQYLRDLMVTAPCCDELEHLMLTGRERRLLLER